MWILVAILAAFLALLIWQFNRLVGMKRLTENAWADVDVYLKRRAELIPNLVEAVKGAATYERATFERIADARAQSLASRQPSHERAEAEAVIGTGVSKALAIAEAYPELRATENFLKLQADLSDAERHIADARQYYNACVRDFNTMIESFPSSIVAGIGGFQPKDFFEVETATERETPSVAPLNQ